MIIIEEEGLDFEREWWQHRRHWKQVWQGGNNVSTVPIYERLKNRQKLNIPPQSI